MSSDHDAEPEQSVGHAPVLLVEAIESLRLDRGGVFVDLTAGRGGHALEAARRVGSTGKVVLFDLDRSNLEFAVERIRRATGLVATPVHGSFASVGRELGRLGVTADAVLADLGFASTQVDDPSRGLSFMRDGPLDMRLDVSGGMTAAEYLAATPEADLAATIARFGEEPLAGRIAAKIAAARAKSPISTTAQLADLVREAYGPRAHASRMHPATKTFMALRIAVNDELGALEALLGSLETAARRVREGTPTWLSAGARVAVIGFHSLEDRLVKQGFARLVKDGLARGTTDGAVVSSDAECHANPRARSARLRAIEIVR